MSRTPMSSEEKDPTCVLKMLESLTRQPQRVALGIGLGATGSSASLGRDAGLGRKRGSAVVTRLQFDESINIGKRTENINKKRFMECDIEGVNLGLLASVEKKFKLDSSTESSVTVPASPWQFRLMQADLLKARSQIEVLENRNKQLHALRLEQELVFENEKTSLQMQHDGDINTVKDLRSRIEILTKRRDEYKAELAELKAQINSTNNNFGMTHHSLEKKITELKDKLHESELLAHKNSAAGQQRQAQLEIKLASALDVASMHEQQVSELTAKLQEARQDQSEVELLKQQLQESEIKIKSLESEKEEMKEDTALAISQRHKLLKFPEMERELAKLKEDNVKLRGLVQNKLFLEEKVMNLESRLAGTEERDKEFAHLQAKLSSLEASHEEWLTLAKDLGSPARNPGSLRLRFEHLQQRELQLTADSAELKSRLKAALESKNVIAAELEGLKAQFEKQKAGHEQQTNFLHRQRKKLTLVTQERDYYRSQLDSYEKDLTMTTTTGLATSQQEQYRSHIATLEKALQGYRELVEKLESDNLKEKRIGGHSESTDKIQSLEMEKDGLKRENEALKRKQQELELELQYRALKGDFNPTKTKVLHFINNPSSEAGAKREDELFILREECNRLRERIRVLTDGEVKDLTLIVEGNLKTTNSKEVQDLQNQVSTYKVKMQRLKEAFKKTSNEFREIVYMVLGYRIDWKNNNEYHLSSMYAESPDDILVFQYNSENAEVKMLETPFSNTLKSLIDLHLRRQDSYPVFLSAVTLDLFSQQTMATVSEPITLLD